MSSRFARLRDAIAARRPRFASGLVIAAILALAVALIAYGVNGSGLLAPAPTDGSASVQRESSTDYEQAADFKIAGGGAKQVVRASNTHDARYLGRGRSQLNQIPAPRVVPVNIAIGHASCTDCSTLAVALQVSTYKNGSPFFAPQNAAVALNTDCLRCFTVAVAIQYLVPTVDGVTVPPDVREMGRTLDADLRELVRARDLSMFERLTRLSAVLGKQAAINAKLSVKTATEMGVDSMSGDDLGAPLPSETSDPGAAPSGEPIPSDTQTPLETASPPGTEPAPTATPDGGGVQPPEPTPTDVPVEPPTPVPPPPPPPEPTPSPPRPTEPAPPPTDSPFPSTEPSPSDVPASV